jgi:hypothetical protein
MPIQLVIVERRDNADREELGNAAFAACKAARAQEGIISSRFFWSGADNIVFLTEGSADALDAPAGAEASKATFEISDRARVTTTMRLLDPRAGVENYRKAGR